MRIQKLISLPPAMPEYFLELEKKNPEGWFCDSDPPEKKVGSGGGTASILDAAYRHSNTEKDFTGWLHEEKRMVIHSGGESRRLPAYAPYGKSLLPMPVFRWSRGQYIDQKLLDFQAEFYEGILKSAPGSYCTLVGSGDVMFISSDRFKDLPEADVLLFGIWVDEEVASRHGVFFSRKDRQDELAFVRQKPGQDDLRELMQDYLYLMDSGIVLLNERATLKLMCKAGWDADQGVFPGGIPEYYDLYNEMLTSFGREAVNADPDLAELSVRMHPLQEGEFYHFGTNKDLLDSALRLQNRVSDQRRRLAGKTDHHPSIFQQNARVGVRFAEEHHHIWIENAHVPSSWKVWHHHIISGIPENSWKIELAPGICIDMLPLENGQYCLRLYGFEDQFRDEREGERIWMGRKLETWMDQPGLSMMDLPLFPVLKPEEVPVMISLLLDGKGESSLWSRAERLSSRQLAGRAWIRESYRQREAFKVQNLQSLAANHNKSVFYFLDLEKASVDYRLNKLPLPEELKDGEPVIKRINDHMFRSRITSGSSQAEIHEQEAFGILRESLLDTLHSEHVSPTRNVLDDQILWGRSPVRLDLAGGWTDTPPYCIMEGGKVVNLSVELNGQLPLQVYMRPIEEAKIVLRSIDLGAKAEVESFEELEGYAKLGGVFSIPLAALVLAGFGRSFARKQFSSLRTQLEDFGCGIEMSLLAAIPKGSGLGTSSNLAATVLGTLSEFCGLNWDRHEVAYRTLILEQMLTTGGGWQDQYGGIFPGVKLLETAPGIVQKPSIKWLPDHLFERLETREMMLLYYTGVTRVAKSILGEIVKGMFLNSSRHLDIFEEMQVHARETFETMLRNDYEGMAAKVALSWELNQRLDEGTNPPEIRALTRKIDDFLLGYKLLGAGGGGYLLMMARSAEAALMVRQILEKDPPNARARFVDFRVSKSGFQVSRS